MDFEGKQPRVALDKNLREPRTAVELSAGRMLNMLYNIHGRSRSGVIESNLIVLTSLLNPSGLSPVFPYRWLNSKDKRLSIQSYRVLLWGVKQHIVSRQQAQGDPSHGGLGAYP